MNKTRLGSDIDDIAEQWEKIVGQEVELPDGSKHVIGTCLSCEQPMTGPSTDGNLICGKCACGFDDHGQRVSWDEQRRRYARVRGRGIGWV